MLSQSIEFIEMSDGKREFNDLASKQIGVNTREGTLDLFTFKIPVGTTLALVLKPFVQKFQLDISSNAARYANKAGFAIAKGIGVKSDQTAAKIANATDFVIRYGLLTGDIAVDVKRNIAGGYEEMAAVKNALSPYFAANHSFNVSIGSMMTDSNRGIENVRSFIMKKSRYSLMNNLFSLISRAPSIMLTFWDKQKNDLDGADAIKDSDPARYAELMARKEKKELNKTLMSSFGEVENSKAYKDWKRDWRNSDKGIQDFMQEGGWTELGFGDVFDGDVLKNTAKQMFNRKLHKNELKENLKFFSKFPLIGGFLEQLLYENFSRKIDGELGDFAVMKIANLAASYKDEAPADHSELSEQIQQIFRQHLSDCGVSKEPSAKKLVQMSDELSSAIIDQGMNICALVDLIGGEKLMKYSKSGYVYTSQHERADIIAKTASKYTAKVDNKQFYKDSGFTPEDAKKTYALLKGDEKMLFVSLFPPGVLEQLGIDRNELAELRSKDVNQCTEMIAQTLIGIKDMTSEELKSKGMPEDTAKQLLSIAEDFSAAYEYGRREANNYLNKHRKQISSAILKAGATSKDPKFWQKMVSKGEAETAQAQAEEVVEEKPAVKHSQRVKPRGRNYADDYGAGMPMGPDWSPVRS